MEQCLTYSKHHKCIGCLSVIFLLCVSIPFSFYYSTNVGSLLFLDIPANFLNFKFLQERNCTCFSLFQTQHICCFYCCTILGMSAHSVHVISKVVHSFSNRIRTQVVGGLENSCLVTASQPIWQLLRVSPLVTTGKSEMISFFPHVGMASESTPFLYIQAPGSPRRQPHSRTHKYLFSSCHHSHYSRSNYSKAVVF